MYGIARERARDDAEDAMEAESRAIERRATAFLLDDVDLGDAWRDDDGDGEDEGDEENRGARERGRGRSNRRGGRTMTEEEERSGTVMGERVGRREVGEFQDARVRFRLLCPTARIGRVIGKEGKVIKATRAETGARVKVAAATRGVDERVILVASGDELAGGGEEEEAEGDADGEPTTTAERALFRIFDTISGDGATTTTTETTHSGASSSESGENGRDLSASGGRANAAAPICRLLIPRAQVGSLIGKGGAVISAIRASSGATVRVMPATMLPACANRGDELLQITAPARDAEGAERDADVAVARVRRALRAVAKHLREFPTKMTTSSESNRTPLEAFMIGAKTTNGAAGDVDGVAGQMSTRMNLNGVYVPGGTEITFRLLCPVSKTGSVIGRNGEVVQQIRSEIGAKIKVCEQVNDADERIICVSSIDDGLAPMISAQVALFRIYRCIVESGGNDIPLPFRLLVQTSQIGCLIGKGGSIIKQIRGETGATVRVLPSSALPACANEDDELLEIGQWPADACALGIRIVSGRLRGNMRHKAAERMSAAKPAAPTSSPSVALSAAAAATWQQAELMSIGMTQTEYEPMDQTTTLPSAVSALRSTPVEIVPGVTAVNSAHMTIASQHIGSVLGRGGVNISIARRASGARIKLYPGATNRPGGRRTQDTERLLEISGSSEQVSAAQDIVRRFIASSGAMLPELAHLAASASPTTKNIKDEPIFMIS
jgi:poly(rC)-binding protein 2/3/4|tara:strand:+ start:408 stop:2579 length:2172 start_codon:yes stop_codon:yes gene_type:complete